MRGFAMALFLLALPRGAGAVDCASMAHEGRGHTVCTVTATEDLRLFLTDPDGRPWGHFTTLDRALQAQGLTLGFGINAGMYHPDRAPVGLYVEEGETRRGLVRGASAGNFGLVPNGVFCILPQRFAVIETEAFAANPPDCRFATQSGPMLVIGGALHPRFLPDGTSRYIRNGVGVSADGQSAVFVISDQPVTFHEFARFFRDTLGLTQALYLDGSISRLHAPGIERSDRGFAMGPILGVVQPRE